MSNLIEEVVSECTALLLYFISELDHGHAKAAAGLFAENGVWERTDGRVCTGREQILSALAERDPSMVVRHLVTNIRVTPIDDLRARGLAYFLACRDLMAGLGPNDLPRSVSGPAHMGDYVDEFVRTEEGWRIARHKAIRVFEYESGFVPGGTV